jgi:hypothetical protein
VSDGLIADVKVRVQLGVTEMTTWKWDHHPKLAPPGWPPRIKMGRRNYRDLALFESFKKNLIAASLAERKSRLAAA